MGVGVLRRVGCAVVVSVLALPVGAQIPIPYFNGAVTEGFESSSGVFVTCLSQGIFGGQAELCTPSGPHGSVGGGALCGCAPCSIFPQSGARLYNAVVGACEVRFDTSAQRFGTWTAAFVTSSMTFRFFDINDNAVASAGLALPAGCGWNWIGWDFAGLPPITRVVMESSSFVILDDLQADLAPLAPRVYCTPGTTSHGCLAAISATANPKPLHNSPCTITVANLEGRRNGLVFYGVSKQVLAWCTGGLGSSTLCIHAPIVQTGGQNSGGTLALCDGSFSLDWSAYQLAHPGSLGSPWIAGEKVYVQSWFRDPPACRSTNLSNALELTYVP